MTKDEALKLALELLDKQWQCEHVWSLEEAQDVADSIREALAEQPAQQEPVAWPCLIAEADFSETTVTLAMQCTDYKVSAGKHWLYTSPPRTWVGLTTKEIREWWASENGLEDCGMAKVDDFEQVVRAIEAKLKEKNT